MGLVVDMLCAGGAGRSNDGNTARRAFSDPDTFSLITGADNALIVRFACFYARLLLKGQSTQASLKNTL